MQLLFLSFETYFYVVSSGIFMIYLLKKYKGGERKIRFGLRFYLHKNGFILHA